MPDYGALPIRLLFCVRNLGKRWAGAEDSEVFTSVLFLGIFMVKESKFTRNLLFWSCLGITFFYVSLVLFYEYKFSFHSDGAIKSVLARLAITEGRLIPNKWVYANGDLFFVGPQTFSIILYPWLGLSYLSNALSDWLSYIYLLLMVYGSCRVLSPTRKRAAIVVTTIVACGISALNFEFVIGEGAYPMYAALALGLFALASRPAHSASTANEMVLCLLTGVAAGLVCASNSTRGIVTVVAPLFGGWLLSALAMPAPVLRARFKRLWNPIILAVAIGALFGTSLYLRWLLPSVFNYEAAASVGLATKSEMLTHIKMLPGAWFNYFIVVGPWASLNFYGRLLQGCVWLLATSLIFAPLWVVVTPRRHFEALITMSWIVLACFFISFLALIVAAQLFASGAPEIRYSTFAIYGSLCITVILIEDFASQHRNIGLALLLALSVVSVLIASSWRIGRTSDQVDVDGSYRERIDLIDILDKKQVGTIITSYWNAHVLTVLSGGAVDAYPIYPIEAGGKIRPFPHHMPRELFYGTAGKLQAVVLPTEMATPAAWSAISDQLGQPVQRFKSGRFEAWVYSRDIVKLALGIGLEADSAIPADQLMVKLSEADFEPCQEKVSCAIWIEVTNKGKRVLSSDGFKPLRLGIQSIDSSGELVDQDIGRADFSLPIESSESERIKVIFPRLINPKASKYRLCLLQESVAWHCDRTYSIAR